MSNENRDKIYLAVWNDPQTLFGCEFDTKNDGRKENRTFNKTLNIDERGKIVLLQTRTYPRFIVIYNGGSEPEKRDLFDYVGEKMNGGTIFREQLDFLAHLYGIELKTTPGDKNATDMGRRARIADEAAAIFAEGLKRDKDGEVAKYLNDVRRVSRIDNHFGEINAELLKHVIDTLKAKQIPYTAEDFKKLFFTDQPDFLQKYPIVIPYYHNGKAVDFIYRYLGNPPTNEEGKPIINKYQYTSGGERTGYCDRFTNSSIAYICEGEMDAIRLIHGGLSNVMATGGQAPNPNEADFLFRHGIDTIVYIPDFELEKPKKQGDEPKQRLNIINEAIDKIQAVRDMKSQRAFSWLYVCELPHGKDGQKIDADEYGKLYGAEKLAEYVRNNAKPWYKYKIEKTLEEAQADKANNVPLNKPKYTKRLTDIYNRTEEPTERANIKTYIRSNPQLFEPYGISVEALTEYDEIRRNYDYQARLRGISNKLATAINAGSTDTGAIAEIADDFTDLQAQNSREEWDKQIYAKFEDDLESVRTQPETIKTKWDLGQMSNDKFSSKGQIEYAPGDIAVICAQTSHGKTSFLMQSAVALADKMDNKTFLFVSMEENKGQLIQRALNVYMQNGTATEDEVRKISDGMGNGKTDAELLPFIEHTRKQTIKAVIRGDKLPYKYDDLQEYASKLTEQVKEGIIQYERHISPRLKFVCSAGDTIEICGNLLHTIRQIEAQGGEVGGVFIDYIQKMRMPGGNASRVAEIKDICDNLKNCALQTNVPFVVGAQLNRAVFSVGLDGITLANIGEAGDIERIAHDVYLLWNTSKTPRGNKNFDNSGARMKRIMKQTPSVRAQNSLSKHPDQDETDASPIRENYLYIERLKAREGETEIWGLLPFDGESGKIGLTDTNPGGDGKACFSKKMHGEKCKQNN